MHFFVYLRSNLKYDGFDSIAFQWFKASSADVLIGLEDKRSHTYTYSQRFCYRSET
jgi:hypothetical protein